MTKRITTIIILLGLAAAFYACKHEPYTTPVNEYGGFPDDVGKIITTKCATSGCHNAASYTAAGDLRMDTWDAIFNGGSHGAAIVAYSVENSPLLYYINTDTANGPVPPASDRMPPVDAGSALSKDEYNTIRNWIAAGAPDRNGNIPFAENASARQKIYLTQQGCDLVAVIDAERKVVMRYIKVGKDGAKVESPHAVRVSPDGQHAYVCFTAGRYLQRINTNTDVMDKEVLLSSNTSSPSWNILFVTPDNKSVLVCDYNIGGGVVKYNASAFSFEKYFDKMNFPHGVASTQSFDTLYVSAQFGNTIYKMPSNITDFNLIQKVSLNGQPAIALTGKQPGQPDPHEVMLTPDGSKLIVTCQGTNEVKVLDARTNAVLKTFTNVGIQPQEIALSKTSPYAYITCTDSLGASLYTGSVFIFNYQDLNAGTYTIDATTGWFNQPHGITVDDRNNVLYVASINNGANGPPPHHASSCSGKNGYYTIFNSKPPFTRIGATRKYEVSVAPYSADVRFK